MQLVVQMKHLPILVSETGNTARAKQENLLSMLNLRMHLLSLERMQNFKTVTPVDVQLNEAKLRAR